MGWKVLSGCQNHLTVYLYLVNIGGATYSARLKYLMLCGSPIIQVEEYFEFFEPLLTRHKHFIPSGPDMAAIEHAITQARATPHKSATIGVAAQTFAKECLRMADVYYYMREMLEVNRVVK